MTSHVDEAETSEQRFLRAVAFHEQGRFEEAARLYRAILDDDAADVGCLYNFGILCSQQGRYDDAIRLTREVLRHRPDLAEAYNALGVALRHRSRLDEAEICCREAVRRAPEYAEAQNSLADVLTALERFDEAEASCRAALRLRPKYAEAHNNLGIALAALGRLDEAETSYRAALRLKPGNAATLNNLAIVLMSLARLEEAEACCREALSLRPGYAAPLGILGPILTLQGRLGEAAAVFARAAALDPDDADALAALVFVRQRMCDWSSRGEDEVRFRERAASAASPSIAFRLLGVSSTAEEQFVCASRMAAKFAVPQAAILPPRTPRGGERLRLGYLFLPHPTGHLIAGLIERHDRRRFEVIGYCSGPDDGSGVRDRLAAGFDRFVDISRMQDRQAAQLIHADQIDIAVDLIGFKPYGRPKILAYRPAPVQVNYLGYPGTMGAEFIDYIIVDGFVAPPDRQAVYSERLVHLPGCYQCNDNQRAIAARTPARAECGLPAEGFVFCCFNDSYKITPEFFESWMRLLRAVPASVLWLLEFNPEGRTNLGREAAARGVAPERLVFAPRLPPTAHLARHRLADLFLDTFPFNAHTTASDALWAGLPVLTCVGDTFVARVGGSLLRAVGLAELVTTSRDEYEALALRLAREPASLARLRSRLAENRDTFALFDTEGSARNLEAAYRRMHQIRRAGGPPIAFSVAGAAGDGQTGE